MTLKFVILGCGSSMGVPRADGFFGNCDLKNKKNYRTRCSALIKFDDQNLLIDSLLIYLRKSWVCYQRYAVPL